MNNAVSRVTFTNWKVPSNIWKWNTRKGYITKNIAGWKCWKSSQCSPGCNVPSHIPTHLTLKYSQESLFLLLLKWKTGKVNWRPGLGQCKVLMSSDCDRDPSDQFLLMTTQAKLAHPWNWSVTLLTTIQ